MYMIIFIIIASSINQKKIIMRRITTLLLFLCLAATTTFGGGYQVGLHSMRNIGMGLIGTSLTYDASSLFYNPGGASFVNEKFSFSGGMTFLMARTTFQSQDVNYQTNMNHKLNTPFYFYAAYKPIDDLSIGLAVNTPYGLSMSWPDNWEGRYLIQNLSFKAITFQPTLSWKIKDVVGFGAGIVIAYGDVDLNKAVPVQGEGHVDGTANITGKTTNFGFNLGLMVHPIKGLNFGVDFRSKVAMEVSGADVTFKVPSSVASNFPNTTANVTLPLPANLDFGISYEFNDKLMIGATANYVFWEVYDSLIFDFKQPVSGQTHSSSPKLYQNRLILRLGGQYKINKTWVVRAGGYYDPSPVPTDYLDPMLPSSNEIGLTCGISVFPMKGLSIDAAFEYLMGSERTDTYSPANFAGTYNTVFYIPGIGLTYNF
jgi:long-chain fatty acid transport protein